MPEHSCPPNFRFSLKVHRYFTNIKRLNVDDEFIIKWRILWAKCVQLRPKLAVILFQLPVLKLKNSQTPLIVERLHKLQTILPKRQKIVFECRDLAWDCKEIKEIFQKYNWCFCVIHINNEAKWIGELKTGFFPITKVLWATAKWGGILGFTEAKGNILETVLGNF